MDSGLHEMCNGCFMIHFVFGGSSGGHVRFRDLRYTRARFEGL